MYVYTNGSDKNVKPSFPDMTNHPSIQQTYNTANYNQLRIVSLSKCINLISNLKVTGKGSTS